MSTQTDEEAAIGEMAWLRKRREEERRREAAAIEFQKDFCARFSLKHEEEDLLLIRVRAERSVDLLSNIWTSRRLRRT
jgi:hypothetical protein